MCVMKRLRSIGQSDPQDQEIKDNEQIYDGMRILGRIIARHLLAKRVPLQPTEGVSDENLSGSK
jgi:hypothetical protein